MWGFFLSNVLIAEVDGILAAFLWKICVCFFFLRLH